MRFEPVPSFPPFDGTIGLSFLEVEEHTVRVSVTDDWLTYIHLRFSPFQGLRLTTEDCFPWPQELDRSDTLLRVVDSPWIEELRAGLAGCDPSADFMDRAHHFLILSRHSVVEVAAWEVTWETVSPPAAP
jgi:hypothetical protein